MEKENKKMEKIRKEIVSEVTEEVKEEIKNEIPESPETKTLEKKEEAAEKIAEEVVEESEKVVDKISKTEVKKLNDYKSEDKGEKKEDSLVKKIEEGKKEKKKEEEKPRVKKEFALARGKSLSISKKQGMYICSFIKGKKIDSAMEDLDDVKLYKQAVPFKGEIPHRKGKGMMSGRYPIKAAGLFINILKALKGNSIVNGLDLDKTVICSASASWASRPARRGNRQAKRTHVILEAREDRK